MVVFEVWGGASETLGVRRLREWPKYDTSKPVPMAFRQAIQSFWGQRFAWEMDVASVASAKFLNEVLIDTVFVFLSHRGLLRNPRDLSITWLIEDQSSSSPSK